MELRINRRGLAATALALVLAAETAGVVAASFPGTPAPEPHAFQVPAGNVLAAEAAPELPAVAVPAARAAVPDRVVEPAATPAPAASPTPTPKPAPKATAKPKPSATTKPAPRPKVAPKPRPKATPKPASRHRARTALTEDDFSGANHVWVPALGISRAVRAFPCDRNRPPDSYMYRWGCAGANNVYLLGHAYSVMEPLHDAYVAGRLHRGLQAFYAGANGTVHTYVVKYWKVVLPTPDASWAWAAQPVPSMTLQTCVGKDSKYRLMVRLVEVDG